MSRTLYRIRIPNLDGSFTYLKTVEPVTLVGHGALGIRLPRKEAEAAGQKWSDFIRAYAQRENKPEAFRDALRVELVPATGGAPTGWKPDGLIRVTAQRDSDDRGNLNVYIVTPFYRRQGKIISVPGKIGFATAEEANAEVDRLWKGIEP